MSCAVCGSERTHIEVARVDTTYCGKPIQYPTKYVKCDACDVKYRGAEELNFNAAQSRAALVGQGFDPDEMIFMEGEAIQ